MRYLLLHELKALNTMLNRIYSPDHPFGVRDELELLAAAERPIQSLFDEEAFPTFPLKCAALFSTLLKKRPFEYGNRRTAFAALVLMMHLNGWRLTAGENEAEQFTRHVWENGESIGSVASWIEERMEKN
ncbi:type II toxin-antitoxin system death-on-curing family toxin [Alkalicoccus chagannorensis]|uniref:type II toxin-antitoxin system death-on-curing family toxin n=1 Tax=Alkalicoccus chagannorensis TaxID=427072 RepID=UPI000415B18B|nr:type II toxin-antitoxin system death-on-curing family toxin [Alkalicoccus chagannorensis]